MSEIEVRIKDKMLALLERVIDDPHLRPDEWGIFFGDTPIVRAVGIVSKLKGRPMDDDETKKEEHIPLSREEKELLMQWLNSDGAVSFCAACEASRASLREEKKEDKTPRA